MRSMNSHNLGHHFKPALAVAVILAAMVGFAALNGCGGSSSTTTTVAIDPADFSTTIDNKHFPLEPGTTYIYESGDGGTRIEVVVTNETKVIQGVTCVVVRDTVTEGGALVEDTYDWYAQDKDGNVWYFGEDTKEYQDGQVVSTAGSWEAGVKGAVPGYIMKAEPRVGDRYQQEYLKGEAEDMAEVLALDASATVPYGSFAQVLKTKEWTPLEPDVEEEKLYAPGVGLIRIEVVKGGSGVEQLVQVTGP
ncbi:MAG TPA: hypothetical protein VJP78_11460 [Thermoleophilia bacterium]|nr:hypothetical protein [Thermoleophilia bacterium]